MAEAQSQVFNYVYIHPDRAPKLKKSSRPGSVHINRRLAHTHRSFFEPDQSARRDVVAWDV